MLFRRPEAFGTINETELSENGPTFSRIRPENSSSEDRNSESLK
jgi:hypothetical protein